MKRFPLLFLLAVLPFCLTAQSKLPKLVKNDFVYVPAGSFLLDSQAVSVQSFFLYKTEVSNKQYRMFLADLAEKGAQEKLQIAAVRAENWTTAFPNSLFEPMAKLYHVHEAYDNYPVVNITWEGAKLYCEWLTEKINESLAENQHILVRLPLRSEFVRAGKGTRNSTYAWEGDYLRNDKGEHLCNYKHLPDHLATLDDDGVLQFHNAKNNEGSSVDLTTPVKSYFPSEFGLYNMNGNVAEMTNEKGLATGGSWNNYGYDVRLESVSHYTDVHPTIGFRPVFTYISPRVRESMIKDKD